MRSFSSYSFWDKVLATWLIVSTTAPV
jgi:hypothetical protein